jgi:hypothetical protein
MQDNDHTESRNTAVEIREKSPNLLLACVRPVEYIWKAA